MDEIDHTGDHTDARVVARMRSALDELTAGVDDAPDGLVPLRRPATTTRRRGAWLGAAAATVLLAGGAVWALGSRSEEPVASPDEVPASVTVATGAPTSTQPGPATTSVPATRTDAPSFTITSARLAPGPVSSDDIGPTIGGPLFLSWRMEGLDGFLFATATDRIALPEGAATDELDPPNGEAQLVWPSPDDALVDVPWIRWSQPDGSVWAFQAQGLYRADAPNEWIDLVFEAVPGSGLPIVLPDERATLLSFGGVSTAVVTQAYTSVDAVDAGTVDLTVTDGGAALATLAGATDVREVQIAGTPGWLGTFLDGHVEVVWEATPGWWGLLGISPELADEADDILASVVRTDAAAPATTVATPEPDQLYRTTAGIIQTGDGPPMIAYAARFSNPPQGGDVVLEGLDWADVPDAQTLNGTTWSGTLELVGTFDGEVFTLTRPPAPPTGSVSPPLASQELTPDCTDADVQPLLDTLRGLDLETLGVIMNSDDRWDGRCGVFVWALTDTPELREALAPLGDQVRTEFAITPI